MADPYRGVTWKTAPRANAVGTGRVVLAIAALVVLSLLSTKAVHAQPQPAPTGSTPASAPTPSSGGSEATRDETSKKTEVAAASAELERLKAEQQKALSKTLTLSEERLAIQREIDRKRAELEDLTKSGAASQERRDELERALVQLEQKEDARNREIGALNEQRETLLGQIDTYLQKKATLEKDLAVLQERLARANGLGVAGIGELITVFVGTDVDENERAVEVKPLEKNAPPRVVDTSDGCRIVIAVKDGLGVGTLREAGLRSVEFRVDVDARTLPLEGVKLDLNTPRIVIEQHHLCAPHRQKLSNKTPLRIEVNFVNEAGVSLLAYYRVEYARSLFQLDLGIGTYFAGGDVARLDDRSVFAVFPALRIGGRLNVPFGYYNQDFFLQVNVLALGGGFLVSDSAAPAASSEEAAGTADSERLSVFVGASLQVSKYVEAGYAYDWLNRTHLLVIAPGQLLSASFLTL